MELSMGSTVVTGSDKVKSTTAPGWIALPIYLFGIIGAAAVIAAGGFATNAMLLSAALVASALLVAPLMVKKLRADMLAAVQTEHARLEGHLCGNKSQCIHGLDSLCVGVLPVWYRQIDMARTHTEEATINLAKRFDSLSHGLDKAISLSNGDGEGLQLGELLKSCQQELNTVISSMRAALDGKQ